jgi:hypothetical protein
MDEYLFITLAKLKADRLRLEREQRAAVRAVQPGDEHQPAGRPSERNPSSWLSPEPQWREQS